MPHLDTLRISDINLRRMCDIVEHVHDEKAVVTRSHFERYMTDRDTAVGYLYKVGLWN